VYAFATKDINVLREHRYRPPPCPQYVHVWREEMRDVYTWHTRTVQYLSEYTRRWVSYEEHYSTKVKKLQRWQERVPNPDWDWRADDTHHMWINVHHHVYRNGSVTRCSAINVRLDRRLYHQAQRARAKVALRNLVDEFYNEPIG
jgi:hypothetical protein